MVEFESIYGGFILQYIAFKRSLGYKYTNAEFRFRVFDRLAVQEGCNQIGLTKSLFEKWMKPTANESESNRYRRVNDLINFSRFLNDLGVDSYCPRNIPHRKIGFTPYIFTCYPSNYPRLEFSDYLGNNRQNQWEQMTNRSIICGNEVVLFAVKKLASDAAVTSTRDSRRNPSLWLFLVGQEASGAVLSIGDMDWLWIRTI